MSSDKSYAAKSRIWSKISDLKMPTKKAIMADLDELEAAWPSWGWFVVGFGAAVGLVVGFLIGLLYLGAF